MTRRARRAGKADNNTLMAVLALSSVGLLAFAFLFSGGDDVVPDTTPDQVAATAKQAPGEQGTAQRGPDAPAPQDDAPQGRAGTDTQPDGDAGARTTGDDAAKPQGGETRQQGRQQDQEQEGGQTKRTEPEPSTAGIAEKLSGGDVETDPASEKADKDEWERRLGLEDDVLVEQAGPISAEQTRRMRAALSAFHDTRRQLTVDVQSGKIDRATFRANARATFKKRKAELQQILGPAFARLDFDRAHFLAEKKAHQ